VLLGWDCGAPSVAPALGGSYERGHDGAVKGLGSHRATIFGKGIEVEYTRLGRTGLRVRRIGLGCMSYGNPAAGMHQWALDEDAAAPFFRQAVELGVTSGTPRTSTRAAPQRSSSGGRSQGSPAVRTLCWPPR